MTIHFKRNHIQIRLPEKTKKDKLITSAPGTFHYHSLYFIFHDNMYNWSYLQKLKDIETEVRGEEKKTILFHLFYLPHEINCEIWHSSPFLH